jgi:C4-dicarboxylate transporter DctQ subunit
MSKFMHVVNKLLSFIEEWSLFIATMVALFALFFNVVLRYGFNYTLAWSEEMVREVIILTTFIGLSAAIKARSMIKIDALVPDDLHAGPGPVAPPRLWLCGMTPFCVSCE